AAGARFLVHYALGDGSGHIQSLILTAVCLIIGGLLFMMGLIADLIATNRKLLERVHLRLQHIQHGERSTAESLGTTANPATVKADGRKEREVPSTRGNEPVDKSPL